VAHLEPKTAQTKHSGIKGWLKVLSGYPLKNQLLKEIVTKMAIVRQESSRKLHPPFRTLRTQRSITLGMSLGENVPSNERVIECPGAFSWKYVVDAFQMHNTILS